MKKLFIAGALLLGLTSCQKETFEAEIKQWQEKRTVEFNISGALSNFAINDYPEFKNLKKGDTFKFKANVKYYTSKECEKNSSRRFFVIPDQDQNFTVNSICELTVAGYGKN